MLKGSSILYLYVGCSCLTVAKSDASIRTMLKVSRAFTLGFSYKLLIEPCSFFCSEDSPSITHCYSRLLHSVQSTLERGKFSTSLAVNQRNILRIGECL